MTEYKCKACGGNEVEVRVWFNPNSLERDTVNYSNVILEEAHFLDDKGDYWCIDCDDNCEMIITE